MNLFSAFQHDKNFSNVAGAGFRLLGGLNPKENRVAIGAIQAYKEICRVGA